MYILNLSIHILVQALYLLQVLHFLNLITF